MPNGFGEFRERNIKLKKDYYLVEIAGYRSKLVKLRFRIKR